MPKSGKNRFSKPKRVVKNQSKRQATFKRYSRKEYAALWSIPKSEVIKDIEKRHGVKQNLFNGEKKSDYVSDVRVIPRKTTAGGWYYSIKIKGQRAYTTGLSIAPTDIPKQNEVANNPEDWWKEHTCAEEIWMHYQAAQFESVKRKNVF